MPNAFAWRAQMESMKFAEHLSSFGDVARVQSFSEVARRRGMVASSVARQIDALESELKVALFTRSTRALVPTNAGEMLLERAVKILHDMTEMRSLAPIAGRIDCIAVLPAAATRLIAKSTARRAAGKNGE